MNLTLTGTLAECVLISCQTPAERVRPLVPCGLELITHEGMAFWNIVLCRVEGIRPPGIPSWLGISYSHVAYRLYVRAILQNGAEQRGLYFLRSDVDSTVVHLGSGLLTDFKPHRARIDWEIDPKGGSVSVVSAGGTVRCCFSDSGVPSARELEQILKYEPAGLSVDGTGKILRVVEVVRDESLWQERPIQINDAYWEYLESLGEHHLPVVRATRVNPLPYRWRLGKTLPLGIVETPASLVAS